MKKLLFGVLTFALIITSCVKDDLADLDKKIDDLKTQITALAEKVAGVATLQTGLTAAQAQLTALTTAVAAIPDTDALSESLETLTANVATIQTALGTLAIDVAAGTVTSDAAALIVAELQASLILVQADITTLLASSGGIEVLQAQIVALQTQLASLSDSVAAIPNPTASITALQGSLETITANVATIQTALGTLAIDVAAGTVTSDAAALIVAELQASLIIAQAGIDQILINTNLVAVLFYDLTANGTSLTVSTTVLTLTFSADPIGLAVGDITVTGATKGALTGSGLTRSLAISAITVANNASVTVALTNPSGYTITNDGTAAASRSAVVNVAPPVVFSGLTANGTSLTVSTTVLTLTFNADPTTLAVGDITVTGATKGALTGTGLTRSLAISAITVLNGASVTVAILNPLGFTITPSSKTVAINRAPTAVAFSGLTANGTDGTVSTTILTLTFNADPTTLAEGDITVTGATRGALTGTGLTRLLAISAITVLNGENVTVAVLNPSGFTITPSSKTVPVWVGSAK